MDNDVAGVTPQGLQLIPARRGAAVRMEKGQTVRIVNTHGSQVVDTWAFSAEDTAENLSMEHSRTAMSRVNPKTGDTLVSNQRRPMLTLVDDTTSGTHDTLIAACDINRYRSLGAEGYHDNCSDNLKRAMSEMGLSVSHVPSPLNLFMNVPLEADGSLSLRPSRNLPGQYVSLRAEMDLIIAFSACPMDMVPVNNMAPSDVHFAIS